MAQKVVSYTIKLNDQLSPALGKADTHAKKLEGNMKSLATGSKSFFAGLAQFSIVQGLTQSLFGAAKGFLKMGSDMEQTKVAFEVLLGGADKSKKMLGEMKSFADQTPFEFKDLAKAGKTMLGFQIQADKVLPIMKTIGDISMGDAEKMQSLTLAFSQSAAAGRLNGQDLNQMISAGFNPLGELARTTGKDIGYFKDEMTKGRISTKMLEEAFKSATSKGGPYFEMMKIQSETLAGRWSTLQDKINSFGIAKIEDVMPWLKDAIKFSSDLIGKADDIIAAFKPLTELFGSIFSDIQKEFNQQTDGMTLDSIIKNVKEFVAVFQPLFDAIGYGIKLMINAWGEMGGSIIDSIEPIKKLLKVVSVALAGIIIPFMAMQAAILKLISVLIDVFNWIYKLLDALGVIDLLEGAFDTLFGGIVDGLSWAGDKLQWLYDTIIKPIVEGIEIAIRGIEKITGRDKDRLEEKNRLTYTSGALSKGGISPQMIQQFIQAKEIEEKSLAEIEELVKSGVSRKEATKIVVNKNKLSQSLTLGDKDTKKPTSPSSVKSNSPNNINITIGKLIEEFTVEVATIKESYTSIKEIVAQALIEAVNDVSLAK